MHEREKSQLDSIKIWQVFDGLIKLVAFANTIKNLISSLPGLPVAVHLVKTVYRVACKQHGADGVAHWVNRGGQQGFGQLYNQVLDEANRFPDASKAASTLLGYGRTAQQVIPDMDLWVGCLSFLVPLQNLALVFRRLRAVVRCLDKIFTADQ